MRTLRLSHYSKTNSKTSRPVELTWPEDASSLASPLITTADREEVPLIMAGTNDGQRGDAHVTSRSMFCMDIDCKRKKAKEGEDDSANESDQAWGSRSGKVRADFQRALDFMNGPEGFDHTWHTTHSHTDTDRLGYRVWVPTAEDVPQARLPRWRDAMHAVNVKVFNLICDTTTYNPERLMRLPAMHPDRVELYKSGARTDGKLLSFDTVLGWWEGMPTSEKNRRRGDSAARATKIYMPARDGDEFALPRILVDKLRIQCGQIAQGNQRIKHETRNALVALANAESLHKGERDNGLIGLIGIFTNRFLEHEARPLVESLLLPVLEKTHADDPDDPIKPGIPDPHALCDWVIAQVEMRRTDAQNPLGHTKVTDEEAGYIRDWTDGARSGGMAEAEFNLLAEQQNLTTELFKRRLLVIYNDDVFLWQVNRYSPRPYRRREFTLAIAQAALAGVGISRKRFDEAKNEFKVLSLDGIKSNHSINVKDIRGSYLVDRSYVDETTKTFVEAMGKRRRLLAKKHDAIHEFLWLFGNRTEKLLDWVSIAVDPSKPLAILFMIMPRNSGKNLLANSLARRWEHGVPVKIADVFSPFNADQAESPLIFADEELPKLRDGSLGARLRTLVSEPGQIIRRKFMPNVRCEGYARLFVAANSDSPLRGFAGADQPTDADLAAIAERVLTIETDDRAAKFLLKHSKEELDSWRTENKLAEHALWLAENHKLKEEGRRFAVEGNSEKALYKLIVADELTSQILDWFVGYGLKSGNKNNAAVAAGLFSHEGELYATLTTVTNTWDDFRPSYRMGSREPFIKALDTLCHPGRFKVRRQKEVREYWHVNLEYLTFYAKRLGIGAEQIRRAIIERNDDSAEFLTDDAEPVANVAPIRAAKKQAAQKYPEEM